MIAAVMIFSSVAVCAVSVSVYASTSDLQYNTEALINSIIDWNAQLYNSQNGKLINENLLENVGTADADWLVFALSRYTKRGNITWDYAHEDDYYAYIAEINNLIGEKYPTADKLGDMKKASELHRLALTLTATGGDPMDMPEYDFIAETTYDRGCTLSPGKQGVNGWIWGLITLDSMVYEVPSDAYHTRYDFISEIMRAQLSDGGFALMGNKADVDMTAMAVQALAPYYNSDISYQYVSSKIKNPDGTYAVMRKTVRQVVDNALNCLALLQNNDGDFSSNGIPNCESTAQVLMALCSLNINPVDATGKFIKKGGKTIFDGLMKYRHESGGFVHSLVEDAENPDVKSGEVNITATNQAMMALVALYRYENGMRALFDLRPEIRIDESSIIMTLDNELDIVSLKDKNEVSRDEAMELVARFELITPFNRRYVKNYYILSRVAAHFGIVINEIQPYYSGNETGNPDDVILVFTQKNKTETEKYASAENISTKDRTVIRDLLFILEHSEEFESMEYYREILENANKVIDDIEKEIEAINNEIKEKLYPFDAVRFEQKKLVDELVRRYEALSDYDKMRITHGQALLQAQELLSSTQTWIILAFVFVMVAFSAGIVAAYIVRKRRNAENVSQQAQEEDKTDTE